PELLRAKVKSFVYSGGVLPGADSSDLIAANGVLDSSERVDYQSSAVIDPGTTDGTCAVTGQVFTADGSWRTKLVRLCGPLPSVTVPAVTGGSVADATTALQGAFLRVA